MSRRQKLFVPSWLGAAALVLFLAASAFASVPCKQIESEPDAWVTGRVNALVLAARRAYESDRAQAAYGRTLDGIARAMEQCRLADDRALVKRYPEFVGYIKTLSLERQPDHELGFNVPDSVYFSETRAYVTIPDFLVTPNFLRAVSRFATLREAKAMLEAINAGRSVDDQLIFFSYQSRHLGTPDNPNSFWRLLIVVPGNAAQGVPEKWVQFGVPDPKARAPVRNVSVVSVVPSTDGTTNAYFKDYFRTFRRNGSITIKGRWELGEGDDNCALCHKSGILPIFPVSGTVSRDELGKVGMVNERFLKYVRPRFDKYLDASKLGPGLGATRASTLVSASFDKKTGSDGVKCGACHQPSGLGALNWPMDRTLISSYVKGGQMPFGFDLTPLERNRLYTRIIQDYFAIDERNPGILKAWLLGQYRSPAS
ncbi:MAG TPA: hypothetical protein VN956_20855 [Pyrinomonadaceae bacterium]|nr:hypothetical protein [Pyrinomonadaceae bacterium]